MHAAPCYRIWCDGTYGTYLWETLLGIVVKYAWPGRRLKTAGVPIPEERLALIHGFLRDQRAVAGIGRRLANEVCHRAKLSPFASTGKMNADDAAAIAAASNWLMGRKPRMSSIVRIMLVWVYIVLSTWPRLT